MSYLQVGIDSYMSMAKSKKKALKKEQNTKKPQVVKNDKEEDDTGFDFGGFPKDVDLKRNIGCGG